MCVYTRVHDSVYVCVCVCVCVCMCVHVSLCVRIYMSNVCVYALT